MCWRCERMTDSSLSMRSYWLHTLSISWFEKNKKGPENRQHSAHISALISTACLILVPCPPTRYTPAIHRTFWPGWWPAPPGAKPSGSVLLPGPWALGFSSLPAVVWTHLMHNERCPARKSLSYWQICVYTKPSAELVGWLRTLSICNWASSTDRDCSSLSHPHNLVNTAWRGQIKRKTHVYLKRNIS